MFRGFSAGSVTFRSHYQQGLFSQSYLATPKIQLLTLVNEEIFVYHDDCFWKVKFLGEKRMSSAFAFVCDKAVD